jgi:arsenite methyltransferase
MEAVQDRYGKLAESTCCLSCGGAVDYANAKPGEVGLDLGCGRGNDVIRLAEQVEASGFVYGMDITEEMLNKAKRTASKLAVTNVGFLHSTLEKIPLGDNIVDIVISNCTLNHAEDKQAVWDEIYRVLKPGGRFAISDIYAIEEVPAEYKNDPQAVAECWAGSQTRDEYIKTVVSAGFTDTIEFLEESNPYPKGKIEVASITLAGIKPSKSVCC